MTGVFIHDWCVYTCCTNIVSCHIVGSQHTNLFLIVWPPGISVDLKELLKRMLEAEPSRRATVDEILNTSSLVVVGFLSAILNFLCLNF